MPIYDYVCSKCGRTIEVMHAVHGHGPSTCTECRGPMKKAFSALAVHYKGTGWARNERSSSGRPSRSTSSETAPASGDGAGSAKSGTTEATKPASPSKDPD
ncbi:MAG: FmdB family zinc ribbon protein [Candidatus Limnocylindrales bacterium]